MKSVLVFCCALLVLVVLSGCAGETDTGGSALPQILEERPRIAEALDGHPEVMAWIESRFEPGAMPVELMWDPAEPQGGNTAEHEYLSESGPAAIRISETFSGLDQATALIYELNNIEDYPQFQLIYNDAVSGEIDREEYARRMLAQEFAGVLRTRAYLDQHLADHRDDPMHENPMYFRIMQADSTLEAHIERYAANGFDLHTYYEEMYDQEILPKRGEG